MKTKPYYPRPWQIPGLLSGEITRVIVPFRDQPGKFEYVEVDSEGQYYIYWDEMDYASGPMAVRQGTRALKAPYQPGDVLAGKEAGEILSYAESHNPHTGEDEWAICGWRYSVDGAIKEAPWANYAEPVENWVGDCSAEKKSPILQPAEFIRLHLRVLTVEAVRVAEIGEDAARQAGYPQKGFVPAQISITHLDGSKTVSQGEVCDFNWQTGMNRRYTADHGPDAWDGWAWSVQVERVDAGIPASLEKA